MHTQKVLAAVDKGTRIALNKSGAWVRTVARRSLKYGKGKADPGKIPKLHTKPSPLRQLILYAYDPTAKEVVVGALEFKGKGAKLLEHGGTSDEGHVYRGNPFMKPALEVSKDKLADFMKGVVKP